jgi:hypothetical protein
LNQMRELNHCLLLLIQAELVPGDRLRPLVDESDQRRAILSKAVASAKGPKRSRSAVARSGAESVLILDF